MYRVAIVLLLLIFAGLQYRLWVGDGSVAQISQIRHERNALAKVNAQAVARNDAMQKQIRDLKSGNAAAEGRARSEMGMIKPGETFFLTEPDDSDPGDDQSSNSSTQPEPSGGQ